MRLVVSDDLDVVVHPPGALSPGLIRIVDAGGDAAAWPDEVRELVAQLVEAALMLAEWRVRE